MKKVLVELTDASTGLGDIIVLIPYLEKFRVFQNVELYFKMKNFELSKLFIKSFPEIKFIERETLIFSDKHIILGHSDHSLSLQQIFAKQLGFFDAPYIRPTVDLPNSQRQIKNKYVCLSTHSTAQLKFWNHPNGIKDHHLSSNWNDLCSKIRKMGYTPVCVDYYPNFGVEPFYNYLPSKAQKKIGLDLFQTLDLIEHCEFFIGLSSGLTWLAHAAGKPVCMISNFSEDWYEIDPSNSDYIRITNKSVCHGCWNLVGKDFVFEYEDWYWCPKHKNTPRQFECHTSITSSMVINQIQHLLK